MTLTAKEAKELALNNKKYGRSNNCLLRSIEYADTYGSLFISEKLYNTIRKAAYDGEEDVYLFFQNLEERDFAKSLLEENGYTIRADPSNNSCSIYVKWDKTWN